MVVAKRRKPVATICIREGERNLVIHALGANRELADSISSRIKETAGWILLRPKVLVTENLPRPVMTKEEAAAFARSGLLGRMRRWAARRA